MKNSLSLKVISLSLGKALTGFVSFLILAILSRTLTLDEYASYRQVFLTYQFATPFLMLGLNDALYYFLPSNKKQGRRIVIENILALAFMALLFGIFIVFGGNHLLAKRFSNEDIITPILWLIPYAFFMLPATSLAVVMVVQNKITVLNLFNIISRISIFIFVAIIALRYSGFQYPLIGNIIISIFASSIAIILMIKYTEQEGPIKLSLKNIYKMLKFSVPVGLASMIGSSEKQLDKLIVASMVKPEQFAVYSNGAFEIPFVGIITRSIFSVSLAEMRQRVAEGRIQSALELFKTASARSASFLVPIGFFLFIFAEEFILLLFSEKYLGSVMPFRFYLLLLPFRSIQFGTGLMVFGKTKLILYRTIVSIILLGVLSYLLVSIMGYLGAIVATIVTLYLWDGLYSLFFIAKSFNVRILHTIPIKQFVKIFIISLLVTAPIFLLKKVFLVNFQPVFILLIGGSLFFLSIGFIFFRLGLTPVFVNKFFKNKTLK